MFCLVNGCRIFQGTDENRPFDFQRSRSGAVNGIKIGFIPDMFSVVQKPVNSPYRLLSSAYSIDFDGTQPMTRPANQNLVKDLSKVFIKGGAWTDGAGITRMVNFNTYGVFFMIKNWY